MYTINRQTTVSPVFTFNNSTTFQFQTPIPISTTAGAGLMILSSTAGRVTVTFYAKHDPNSSDAYLLVDATGAPVTRSVDAGEYCQIPTELFPALCVQPVSSAGVVTARYCLKG